MDGILHICGVECQIINSKISDKDKNIIKDKLKQEKIKFDNFKLKMMSIPSWTVKYNLARILPKREWNIIRKSIYLKSNYKCSICGASERLNCHESWEYDDDNMIQYLHECISVCNLCHFGIHPTMASFTAKEGGIDIEKVIEHFTKINSCEKLMYDEYKKYIQNLELYRTIVSPEFRKVPWKIDYGEYNNLVINKCGDINNKISKELIFNKQEYMEKDGWKKFDDVIQGEVYYKIDIDIDGSKSKQVQMIGVNEKDAKIIYDKIMNIKEVTVNKHKNLDDITQWF